MYNSFNVKKVFLKLHKNLCARNWLKTLKSLIKTNLITDVPDIAF